MLWMVHVVLGGSPNCGSNLVHGGFDVSEPVSDFWGWPGQPTTWDLSCSFGFFDFIFLELGRRPPPLSELATREAAWDGGVKFCLSV